MRLREFTTKVNVGDTVYINTRAKNYAGRSGVVTDKEYRRALIVFDNGYKQWFSFYSIDINPVAKCEEDDGYIIAKNVGNAIVCPHCKRVLFDYKNTALDIEVAKGMCKFCHTKVKWDLREARKKAEE